MTKKDLALYGLDLFGDPVVPRSRGSIADQFTVPPFSVLNAREGFWQERKRMWMAYGIDGGVGRDAESFSCNGDAVKKYDYLPDIKTGTSVFDPVLCELSYKWFCPPNGQIVDPFAGGSVRGIVASMLGRRYWGCDLRPEQIVANEAQAEAIVPDARPDWVCGDALEALPGAPKADMIFSCPPYGDLEKYSDDHKDLSAMDYHAFCLAYRRIIMRACERLKDDRFAVFVVGDFRNPKTGLMRGFIGETERAFAEQGVHLYNEMILVTAVGSLPIRIRKQFESGRKIGKTHQNVLVFVKGDWKKAALACQLSP